MMITNNLHITFETINILVSINHMIGVLMYNRHNPGATALLEKIEGIQELHESHPSDFSFIKVQNSIKLKPEDHQFSAPGRYVELTLEAGESLATLHEMIEEQFNELELETPPRDPQREDLVSQPRTYQPARLSPESMRMLDSLADSHPNRAMREKGRSMREHISACLAVLSIKWGESAGSAGRRVMWPLTEYDDQDPHQEAVSVLSDTLLLLLEQLPPQDLQHIQTRSRERLADLVLFQPRSGSHRNPSGSPDPQK